MSRIDFRGARGSNAGDDFHELWALRQALTLLDTTSDLHGIVLEGLTRGDETAAPRDTWEGVDCIFYFGALDAPERIVIDQLKYSAANSGDAWTISRLTHATNKRQDNSVIGRLAKNYLGLASAHPNLIADRRIVVRLVSNQPVDTKVIHALSKRRHDADASSEDEVARQRDRAAMVTATRLEQENFDSFAEVLDLSECGGASRFTLEERILTQISEWTDDDARATVDHLMRFVRRSMMPESKGEVITRHSILAQMGFSDPRGLLPCPSLIEAVPQLIAREASSDIVESMRRGEQHICLYGEGGCGKTTVLQEIEALLPEGSAVVVFDCYGGGQYLDSDAYRHRPEDTFRQLSNDLASRLRVPLLLSRAPHIDYVRAFASRLTRAAKVITAANPAALLVVAIDAADNSVIAANTRIPAETSFIHEFIALGTLPANVRLLVTARTGRLPDLRLLHHWTAQQLPLFSREETASHVRALWAEAPDTWLDDFHHLSRGNARVQRYALQYAGTETVRALEYLRPSGKGLDEVFRTQLGHALRKHGNGRAVGGFCAGLVTLPRPIPIAHLAEVIGLNEHEVFDLCADLAPGIRLEAGNVGFADEDFENFVRVEAEPYLPDLKTRLAEHFAAWHYNDGYAAAYLAEALFNAGRGGEVLDLVQREREPAAIGDPVFRREAQLRRLRIAMKVCRSSGNDVDALLTMLIGAEALKTDAAMREALAANPDLAANFASATASRVMLRDPEQIENHGPLLFHLMAADARDGNAIAVREGARHIQAWMGRRSAQIDLERAEHPDWEPHAWPIRTRDIAAEIEAMLRVVGPRSAIEQLLRWRPLTVALDVAMLLSPKLVICGDAVLVERCLTEARVNPPWDLFLMVPLALAETKLDTRRLEASALRVMRRGLMRDRLRDARNDEKHSVRFLDAVLTACEIVIAHGGDRERIAPVLQCFADAELRRRDRLHTSMVATLDFTLRAHALLEHISGRKLTIESYWVEPTMSRDESPENMQRDKRFDEEKKKQLQEFIGPLLDVYAVRAEVLIGAIVPEEIDAQLEKALARYHNDEERFWHQPMASAMRVRLADSVARLMAVPKADRGVLLSRTVSLLTSKTGPSDPANPIALSCFALDQSLHPSILKIVTAAATAIRNAKTAAKEKLDGLIGLARFLVPVSFSDAESLFNQAIDMSNELDDEAIHQIALFEPLSQRASVTMDADRRRSVARDLAVVTADAAIRLSGYEHFPWKNVARALATFDVNIALAATARWEDEALIERTTLLPEVMVTTLGRRDVSAPQAVALASLLDDVSVDSLGLIAKEAADTDALRRTGIADELARDELLRFGRGRRPKVLERLSTLVRKGDAAPWLERLKQATAFQLTERTPPFVQVAKSDESEPHRTSSAKDNSDPLAAVDWHTHRFVEASEIASAVAAVHQAARASNNYTSTSDVLHRIRAAISIGDRAAHLDALSASTRDELTHEGGAAIVACIEAWHDHSPSVAAWCRSHLLRTVIQLLPALSRWLAHGDSPLSALLARTEASERQLCAALIKGMERHADALGAATVYALVGLAATYCSFEDAARLAERYASRLRERIPAAEQDLWDLNDIPRRAELSISRLLYAFMSDVDVRTRWRAAHALRRMARLGEFTIFPELMSLYTRTTESSFRAPDAPFYWMASRLWLMITLDRIASESPALIVPLTSALADVACDEDFPHLLIRGFAKSAAEKLAANRPVDREMRARLVAANTSPMPRRKPRKGHRSGFDWHGRRDQKIRRFYFDLMDTLPYWYSRALRAFADVEDTMFLDAAERWIVNRWGIDNDPWRCGIHSPALVASLITRGR